MKESRDQGQGNKRGMEDDDNNQKCVKKNWNKKTKIIE